MGNHTRTIQMFAHTPRCALVVPGDGAATAPIREALAREGFATIVQCRGTEMIPALERVGGFDLALVDNDTAGAEALDLIAYLRHRMPGTPILFVSAADAVLLARAARERGASAWLRKPFEPATAAAAVRMALRGDASGPGAEIDDERALVQAVPPRGAHERVPPWAVVLAGGEGRRLRPLVHHIHGEVRPKQYARLIGTRSLLGQTLDRVSLLIPTERTVIVSVRRHRRYLAEALAGRPVSVLAQPHDRGTAAGIMLPIQWIAQRDPEATVAIFPSDHYVAQERRFMAHVADAVAFVDAHPARIVLVGAEATEPETEYGWIEPREPLARIGSTTISSVARFVEKPSPAGARACLEAGALWNTLVIIGRVATLADASRQLLPVVHDRLETAVSLLGTAEGVGALRQAYAELPTASFSSAVLERCAPLLAVSRLSGAAWCDWGSPRRVVRTLRQTGQQPDWLETFAASQLA